MSWSSTLMGKPEAIKRKLAEFGAGLSGGSKEEFEAAQPALETILDLNVNNGVLKLEASGSAGSWADVKDGPVERHSTCQVHVTQIGFLVE